jgi:two-component system phosphate regulon sensor histidine kinase PhoR
LATNSSADAARRDAYYLALRLGAAYVAIVGAALLAVRIAGDGAWPVWLAFITATAAIIVITALACVPLARRLGDATASAGGLAEGRYDGTVEAGNDALTGLARALNAASASMSRTVDALRAERHQLEALLNASSDATIAVDVNGLVTYMNDAAHRLFGGSGTADVGRPFIEAVRDHDLNDLVVAAAEHGERSVRVVAYGQAQRWLQATAVPIEGGGVWAALAVFHDLTEVRRLEGMRRDFISNVSHELRTPLAGIRAASETLQEGAIDDRPAAIEFLSHIQRETDRMTQLVEELLELSRIESGAAPLHFAQIDAGKLVSEAVSRFGQQAERAGLTLEGLTPSHPLPVIGDEDRLGRALGNLVANALKFTPQGGRVTVTAEAEGTDVAIRVSDTGIGIEPDQQARVFERFYKADRGRGDTGTGLGLAIVKHTVLAHEGSVEVESRPGMGSRFTMRLPRR